ncbi:hypothetical protein FJZ19_03505 [Candidatus Pacearchaeota archaeon]|nr:hypothetical protein [Candidatus Pacearchaeota archaeon]
MWFQKKSEEKPKDKSLPELPELPELPGLPISPDIVKEELPVLPTFPNSETGDKINQEAIKSSFEPQKIKPYTKEISSPKEVIKTPIKLMTKELPISRIEPRAVEKQPVFVRIDKFQEAIKNFEDIRKKLFEIENYLSEIKAIRLKEEKELEGWETEILELKNKLESIDSLVFKKIE